MNIQTETINKQVNIEWLKKHMKTVLCSPEYCTLCLNTERKFYSLDTELAVNKHTVCSLRDVVNYVFNFDVEENMPSDNICEVCVEQTIQSYIFIINTKKTFEVLKSCVNDMESKVDDISSTLNDQETYENSNIMIVIEYDDKTNSLLNELTGANVTMLTDKPIEKDLDTRYENRQNENKRPIVVPTPRVEKYPRTNPVKNKIAIQEKVPTPNVTLQEGKIVIEPLTTNLIPASPRFNTYCCTSCEDIFTTYRSLKEHEKAKHNTVIFKCRYCEKVYNTQQYLDTHYRSIHNTCRCRFCHELFISDQLNKHLKELHKNNVYSCDECELVYYSNEKLQTHFKASHGLLDKNTKHKQCIMCLKNLSKDEVGGHKCKFACLECFSSPCIHYNYLMSYREQVLNQSAIIQCLDCDYTTKRKEHLITHVNREHLDHHPFTCGDCGTQFYTKLSLRTHITQFHQDLKCQYCDILFKSIKLLQSHRAACKLISRLHDCNKCVASFDTVQELEAHTNIRHSAIVFPCSLCNKEFHKEILLEEHHRKVHTGIQHKKRRKIIECTVCDITFKNLREMQEHEKVHDPEQLYPCKVCPKNFQSLHKVYVHKHRHYSKKIQCDGCKKQVVHTYINQHKVTCPFLKEGQQHVCDVCGKSFKTELCWKTHQQLHSNPERCVHCDKMIKPSSMKRHLEIKHASYANQDGNSKHQLFQCDACPYITRKPNEFENHVNKVHLKIKPYSCDQCGKQFCGSARLAEHKRTHSTANVCYCTICNKKFANKVCLKMHLRRHTNENPYECNICFERFRSSSIMKTHRMKKHQDKTIACPLCDAMYHLVAEMRFHVKKTHWKQPEPFDYRKIVSEEFYHLFQDRRLQKLGDENVVEPDYFTSYIQNE